MQQELAYSAYDDTAAEDASVKSEFEDDLAASDSSSDPESTTPALPDSGVVFHEVASDGLEDHRGSQS